MDKKRSPDISNAQEERFQKMIARDPDAPDATDVELAKAKPFMEAFPHLAKKMRKAAGV